MFSHLSPLRESTTWTQEWRMVWRGCRTHSWVVGRPLCGHTSFISSILLSHVEKYSTYMWSLLFDKICFIFFYRLLMVFLDMWKYGIITINNKHSSLTLTKLCKNVLTLTSSNKCSIKTYFIENLVRNKENTTIRAPPGTKMQEKRRWPLGLGAQSADLHGFCCFGKAIVWCNLIACSS